MDGLSIWAARPDGAVPLLTLGILLLYVEANRPGRVLPGCTGLFLVSLSLLSAATFRHAHLATLLVCACILVVTTAGLLRIALAARRNKFILGAAGLVHKRGLTRTALEPGGSIEIDGELWPARAPGPVAAGRAVVVAGVHAGILEVRECAR